MHKLIHLPAGFHVFGFTIRPPLCSPIVLRCLALSHHPLPLDPQTAVHAASPVSPWFWSSHNYGVMRLTRGSHHAVLLCGGALSAYTSAVFTVLGVFCGAQYLGTGWSV